MSRPLGRLAAILAALLLAGPLLAQQPTGARLRVYLDCQTWGCDSREFRTEIGWVDWVGEPAAADLHVIMTSQDAGAGQEFVFDFIGRGGLEGTDDRLAVTARDTDTEDEAVRALTTALKAGLAPYLVRRGQAAGLEIGMRDAAGDVARQPQAQPDDPWDLWVFRVGASASATGEERQRFRRLGARFDASRTTPIWKIDFSLNGSLFRSETELNDGEVFVNDTDNWSTDAVVVRSVAARWSAGTGLEASTSTRLNRRFGARTALALEWSFFPYEEANRRALVAHYQLGVSHVRYEELTIFGKLEEELTDQRLALVYDVRQPWGNASAAARYSSYLDDLSKYRLGFNGGISFRVFRGLELNVGGEYEVIRDQIYLPAARLSDEEILVQRRQLGTGYEYRLGMGFSYRFGSIFNNVVNNRFPGRAAGF